MSNVKSKFHVYRSSAGSGKTYTLTREYLKLALRYPDYFKTILAVTFTNKATEEMKTRILTTLGELSSGNHGMFEELRGFLGFSREQLCARAKAVQTQILHNYSAFAVTTIDSFFQKVIRSFAREVGIEGGFNVELDLHKVIDEVVENTIATIYENNDLINWLIEFAIYKISDGKSWEIRRDIKGLSHELFKEVFVGHREHIFERISVTGFLTNFMNDLNAICSQYEQDLMLLGQKACEIWNDGGLDHNDFNHRASGPGGFLYKLSQGIMVSPGKNVLKAYESGVWYAKTSKKKEVIERITASGLQSILEDAINYIEGNDIRYQTAKQMVRYLYTVGVLGEVSRQLSIYRDDHDLLLISDFPVFLNEIIRGGDAPYIYEKIGSKYHHFLIDEFQDTSGLQWENFKPLIQNSIASGNFNMVVGDIKQSIYRWRGGDWKLLLDVIENDIGSQHTEVNNLKVNWRSEQNIIDFNNSFFDFIPKYIQKMSPANNTGSSQEISSIITAYHDSIQLPATSKKGRRGLVNISCKEKTEDQSFMDQAIEQMIDRIEKLQDANYALKDIAILVRRKDEANKVTLALKHKANSTVSKYKYDVVSNESLYLKSAPVVRFLLAALKVLLHHDEDLYAAELIYTYRVHMSCDDTEDPIAQLLTQKEFLSSLNLVDLVEELVRKFQLSRFETELSYILAFQDAIIEFVRTEGNTIDTFLHWWENNHERAIQIPDEHDAIRLMTIHKSKGLQFKVVIVPFCNWKMGHETLHENIVWCQSKEMEPFNALPLVPLRYKKDMEKTLFKNDFHTEKINAYMDNINLLYVTLTRAEEALFITYENAPTKSGLQTVGGLVDQYVNSDVSSQAGFIHKNESFTLGEMDEYSVYEQDGLNEANLDNYLSNPWFNNSSLNIQRIDRLIGANRAKINHGSVVHFALSLIHHREDIPMALLRTKMEYALDSESIMAIENSIKDMFELETVSNWFDRKWKIRNEASLILEHGKVLRPDRVMTDGDQAIVIDFKTGLESNIHSHQVKEYKLTLMDMNYTNVEGYVLYIHHLKVVKV